MYGILFPNNFVTLCLMYNLSFSLASSTLIFVFKCKINSFFFFLLPSLLNNTTEPSVNTFSSRLNLYVYEILHILVSRLTAYIDDIIGDHQCGFRRNRSTIDQIFSIRQILEKKWEYNGTEHQLYVDFKKAYDSVNRETLYSILLEFGIPKKLDLFGYV